MPRVTLEDQVANGGKSFGYIDTIKVSIIPPVQELREPRLNGIFTGGSTSSIYGRVALSMDKEGATQIRVGLRDWVPDRGKLLSQTRWQVLGKVIDALAEVGLDPASIEHDLEEATTTPPIH